MEFLIDPSRKIMDILVGEDIPWSPQEWKMKWVVKLEKKIMGVFWNHTLFVNVLSISDNILHYCWITQVVLDGTSDRFQERIEIVWQKHGLPCSCFMDVQKTLQRKLGKNKDSVG